MCLITKIGRIAQKGLSPSGIDLKRFLERISHWSLVNAAKQQELYGLLDVLRKICPDISRQESRENAIFNAYWELKTRALQAFQCKLMLKTVKSFSKDKLLIADIGDSAGTHMIYLKELCGDKVDFETVSVNLDPRAIEKIRGRGLKAVLKRAEDIEPEDIEGGRVDLFTTFEMVEHLHNPAIFFRRIAKRHPCDRMLITVPYLRQSQVGLHYIRNGPKEIYWAEDEHIFELSPADWTLLLLHSGWKVTFSKIYYQYPRRWPTISSLLRWYWQVSDFEGFWGAILEKDTTYSDLYQDWED